MKKIILIVLMLLFLVGCGISLPYLKGKDISPQANKGNNGVDIVFYQNTPPAEIFENDLFEVLFGLENKGSFNVHNGIYIVSFSPDLETQDTSFGKFGLSGTSMFNPVGESKLFNLKIRAREIGPSFERMPSIINFDICYPYKTVFSGFVCINPDPVGNPLQAKICSVSGQSFSGQGAPVVVSFVDAVKILPHENPALIKPQISLKIKNVGAGIVISKQHFTDACSQKSSVDLFNFIDITGTLSDVPLSCVPNRIKLSQGDNTIVCTADNGLDKSRGVFSAVLKLDLDYGYYNKVSKQVIIKKM